MNVRVLKSMSCAIVFAIATMGSVALTAQDSAKPAPKSATTASPSPSRWDIFLGYSYLAPHGTVQTPTNDGTLPFNYVPVNQGAIGSVSYFFNNHFGLQVEGDAHAMTIPSCTPYSTTEANQPRALGAHPLQANTGCNYLATAQANDFYGAGLGLIYRWPFSSKYSGVRITPFVHALVNMEEVVGPMQQPETWGWSVTGGGGLDWETGWLNNHLAIRILQADYQYMNENYGPGDGGNADINALRLSTGLVLHIGSIAPPPPVTLACSANPTWVYPGDPVTVTAVAGNLNPKETAVYAWSGNGVTGNGTTATVATGSLAPGSYDAKATVTEGKGDKPYEVANCTASLTVKAFEPPTITCSANPSTIKPGDTSTITAVGMSPQNRPLTYSYSASAGTVTGTDTTATFNSTGAAAGTATINCNVADDKGQIAAANTSVTIEAPPPPPGPSPEQLRLESRLALHSVFFPTDMPRATHPEGGLLASQEGTLSTLATDFKEYLQFKPDARLTLSGHTDVRGSAEYNMALSDRRVARTKQFLVEQGVPEASIETRGLGKEQELTDAQVKELVEQNPELTDAQRKKVFHDLHVIVLAQNRRVDVTLSTTGQESVRLYPFNATDAMTLLSEKPPAPRKKAAAVTKKK